ncbi:hypothetical protein [Sphaerothrix gracilis]|uniref:hypothetical protein n=1 Tax=Sphaerothrix gracilis TaxID=3151835 RepID=UPI0031FD4EA0
MKNKEAKRFLQAVEWGDFTSQQIESWTTVNQVIMAANAKGYAITRDIWYAGVSELKCMKDPYLVPSNTSGVPKWLPDKEAQLNMAALKGLKLIPESLLGPSDEPCK